MKSIPTVTPVGFMVYSPEGGMPTVVHDTIERALGEAERLIRLNPGKRFVVMSPILSDEHATTSKAWSDGKAQGRAESHQEIMRAEAISDRNGEQLFEANRQLRIARPILDGARTFQSIVADAVCWLDGFAAAFQLRDDWERPSIPDRGQLRQLNGTLQDIVGAQLAATGHPITDDEIPF